MIESQLTEHIIDAIRRTIGPGTHALHEPYFGGNEWHYLKECVDSTFVSSVGRFIETFEAELARYTGASYAIAVSNGTAGLHVALKLSGVRPDDEVLVPTMSFVATSNAVIYCGAIPHFVDSDDSSFGIDADFLRAYLGEISERRSGVCINRTTGRVIRALLPVHILGRPANVEGLCGVASDFRLSLIEDAGESLGSWVNGRHTGTFGQFGIISFNGNKTITTGGGGAILTNDAALARTAKHISTTAKVPHRWEYWHDDVGYNYRLPNLNAALGCAQLERLPDLLAAKRQLHDRYSAEFSAVSGVRLLSEPSGTRSNYWLQTLLLDRNFACERDSVLAATNNAGIMTRPMFVLNHRLPAFQNCPHSPLPVAEDLEQRIINIPSGPRLLDRAPRPTA